MLRAFRPDDVAARQALGLDAEIIRAFGGTPGFDGRRPMPADAARAWYDAQAASVEERIAWAIQVDGRFVGSARLDRIRDTERHAQYAVGILDSGILGRGLGQRVTRLVLEHAFDALGLHRVALRVLAGNDRAIGCYARCGFVLEGRERESARVDGAWQDDLLMAVLEHEWRQQHLPPRAVAVVVRDGQVLVVRRRLAGRSYSVLPGGGIEPGETPADAAERELLEETSLRARAGELVHEGTHRAGRAASYFLMQDVIGEAVLGGEELAAHGPDNSYELAWATRAELDAIALQPVEARVLLHRLMDEPAPSGSGRHGPL